METSFDNRYKWAQAAEYALFLCIPTIVCTTLGYLFPNSTFLSSLVWALQFAASIVLLRMFMSNYNAITGTSPKGFGIATVTLSSAICAFFNAACYAWLFPDMSTQITELFNQTLATLPQEQQGMMEQFFDVFPRWLFVGTFIKDFIIGWILVSIFARRFNSTPGSTPTSSGNAAANDEFEDMFK